MMGMNGYKKRNSNIITLPSFQELRTARTIKYVCV